MNDDIFARCPDCNSRDIFAIEDDAGNIDTGWQECATCAARWPLFTPTSTPPGTPGHVYADVELAEVSVTLWHDAEEIDDTPYGTGVYVVDVHPYGSDGPNRWRYATLDDARAAYAVLLAGGTLPD